MDTTFKRIPRVMIAAPKSGSGKTAVTCGILEILRRSGRAVQAYKCGPDFIDPMFHKKVLSVPSKNLDPFFLDRAGLVRNMVRTSAGADISVIEGVMGYFDGLGGSTSEASSYDLAVKTDTPVIMVIDAAGTSLSAVPALHGFLEYEKLAGGGRHIEGVIFNRLAGNIFPEIKKIAEETTGVRVLGYVPRLKSMWQSRHLGLIMPGEIEGFREEVGRAADIMAETIDMEGLCGIAENADEMPVDADPSDRADPGSASSAASPAEGGLAGRGRIGLADDEAFCFMYEDNIKVLEDAGAEIVRFSPLHDQRLPDVDGLILPGGYPELHAARLEENDSMRRDIRLAAKNGMPVLAECGGFMYLQQKLTDTEGRTHEMCGALPGEAFYAGRLVRFGYLTLTDERGRQIRGHEFHYYDTTCNGDLCTAVKPVTGKSWKCMVRSGNVIAGFPHLYYPSWEM
ncbi:MAG: cobyrinate a,c-diamide synthase [Lachnospiraceae bacterium]|nr:cobyrinate a,c-diamide synthase [Lachnospiraceae bacterium]